MEVPGILLSGLLLGDWWKFPSVGLTSVSLVLDDLI